MSPKNQADVLVPGLKLQSSSLDFAKQNREQLT